MTKYWILVASKNHVLRGINEGFAQACHGKPYPLKRIKPGDGIIYYSPKLEYGEIAPCQEFTAIGIAKDDIVYTFDMGDGFIPYRKDIRYLVASPVSIKPLINQLNFITDKEKWGNKFRFGAFEIPQADFELIAHAMQVKK